MESRIQRCHKAFILSLFEEDFINIGTLVNKFPNHETGGNLFGLWTNQGNAVVLVATGPGKNCTRSATSFYQDIPYMDRIGNLVTRKYPLCHIGEWHSHHRIPLLKPSEGDCNTIQRNYPRGSQGFVLMIANIIQDGKIKLSPYKFFDELSPYEVGEIEVISTKNPFNEVGAIKSAIDEGKEVISQEPRELLYREDRDTIIRSRERANHYDAKRQARGRSRSPEKVPSRYRPEGSPERDHQHKSSQSHVPRTRSRSPEKVPSRYRPEGTSEREHQHKSSQSHVPRPPSYTRDPANAITITRASGIRNTSPRRNENHRATESSTVLFNRRAVYAPTGQAARNKHSVTSNPLPWYDQDKSLLRKTLSLITERADDDKVAIKRDKHTMQLSFEFQHYNYKWIVCFPRDFPHNGTVTLEQETSIKQCVIDIFLRGSFDSFKADFKGAFKTNCRCRACMSRVGCMPALCRKY